MNIYVFQKDQIQELIVGGIRLWGTQMQYGKHYTTLTVENKTDSNIVVSNLNIFRKTWLLVQGNYILNSPVTISSHSSQQIDLSNTLVRCGAVGGFQKKS